MKSSLIAVVATFLVAAAAGVAIAGLPADPPGSDLRVTGVPVTTTTTISRPVVSAPAATTTVPPASSVSTTAPSEETVPASPVTTTVPATVPSADVQLAERAELVVVAVNAGAPGGSASAMADSVAALGYLQNAAFDADGFSETSVVYYREGLEAEAARLVEELVWPEDDIASLDEAPAFTTPLDVDLAIVLGQDSR